ncbi:glycosyltransferase [Agreia bicolorata]|uniref:glycosyltransferase n=1 Tax=Agreia bicolorata TaxID=110935 RepID=UPI000B1D3D51|nr:glycosyltransferase [Agreia bicolorata]
MAEYSNCARYYPVARVAHLERLSEMSAADFYYSITREDWDERLALSMPQVHRVTLLGFLRRIWSNDYRRLEVPEPLAIGATTKVLMISLVIGAKHLLRPARPTSTLVSYAIENLDQVEKVQSRFRLPSVFVRTVLRLMVHPILRQTSQIAFGTDGARANYASVLGPDWEQRYRQLKVTTYLALPTALPTTTPKKQNKVMFLGAFDERKDVLSVLEAWSFVSHKAPELRLSVLGHGELEATVRTRTQELDFVDLRVNPTRPEIRAALESAHVVVLPSRRTPKWREQVGLPIVEALAAGCEIVTTRETGLATWLEDHGHVVLDSDCGAQDIARGIVSASKTDRSAEDIQSTLPNMDGRILADRWLMPRAQDLGPTN